MLRAIMAAVLTSAGVGGVFPFAAVGSAQGQEAVSPTRVSRLTFDTVKHDFGTVDDSGSQTYTFAFKNTGNAPLNIFKITSTCGCTTAELEKLRYEPGEGGEIEVSLKTAGKKGRTTQFVRLESDDVSTPNMSIEVTADVVPLVNLSTRQIAMGNIDKGQIVKKTVVVTGPTDTFAITDWRSSQEAAFDVSVGEPTIIEVDDPFNKGQKKKVAQVVVEVTTTEETPVGRANATVYLVTNEERKPEVPVNVNAFIQGDIGTMPQRISFGVVEPGESVEGKVRIATKSGDDFRILQMVPQIPVGRKFLETVEFELVEVEGVAAYDLVMKGVAPDAPMPVRGFVVLTTNLPGERVVRVNVSGVVRADPASSR